MAKFNKYLPFVILYFFFNTLFLPLGLLYTTILTPVFLWWLIRQNHFRNGAVFFLITTPFALIHYLQGVDNYNYLRSYILLFTAFIFLLTTIQFLEVTVSLRAIFRKLLILNFFFVIKKPIINPMTPLLPISLCILAKSTARIPNVFPSE